MSSVLRTRLLISLAIGLAATALTFVIAPKVESYKGASCPICMDVNGGTYTKEERGLPLRYYANESAPDMGAKRMNNRSWALTGLVVDTAIWSGLSFVFLSGLNLMQNQKVRRA